jgi:phage tail sheath gpL-like
VLAGDSVDEIGAALAAEFAGDSTVSVSYDADTNTVFFTAKEAGESFDFDASVANVNYDEDAPVDTDVTNGVAAAPQQTEVALGSVEYNTDDVITVNIGSTPVSYTVLAGDSIDDIGVALADLVDLENGVAASYNADTNLITITPESAVVITSDVAKATFSENEATSENDQDASSGSAGVKQVVSATFEDSTVSPGEVF